MGPREFASGLHVEDERIQVKDDQYFRPEQLKNYWRDEKTVETILLSSRKRNRIVVRLYLAKKKLKIQTIILN